MSARVFGGRGAEPAASVVTDERLAFIDNARALGIILVVAGHAPALPTALSDLIFAFHMPLFFLLSGLMVGTGRLKLPTLHRARLLGRSLLLPYLVYFIVSYAFWLAFKRHGLRSTEFEALGWWDPINGFLHGTADGLYFNVVLWFFPCLFVVAVVHHLLRKVIGAATTAVSWAIAAFVFATLHEPTAIRWLWSADCAVVGGAFYAVGAMFNARLKHPTSSPGRAALAVIGAFAACACIAMVGTTGHVDLNHLVFGARPMLYLPMGVAGIIAALACAALVPATRIARWLSTNTLVIFPLHFLMFSVITGVAVVVLGFPADFKQSSPLVALVYVALALAMSVPAAWVFHAIVNAYHRRTASIGSRLGPIA